MSDKPELHPSIVAMVSLASGIASNHPAMGQCQLERLRSYGIPEHQIDTTIEIARHIRDEAIEKIDTAFDEAAKAALTTQAETQEEAACGCSTTASGQACC